MLQALVLVIILIICFKFSRDRYSNARKNYPPGPLCFPWIGSAHALGTNSAHIHVALTKLARKWGPIYRVKVGPTSIVVITDPTIIREAFNAVSSPVTLRFPSETVRQMEKGVSIFFADDRPQWSLMRKLFHPIIRNKPDGTSLQKVIVEETAKLVVALDKHLDQEVHLNPLFLFFTRNIFLQLVLSKSWSFDTENEEEKEFCSSMMELVENVSRITDYFPMLDFLITKSRKIAVNAGRKVEDYMKREIVRRENEKISEENPRDLVDLLILERKRNPKITEEALLITFRDVLFASVFTTSDSLDWMLLYLCTYPDIQEKCFQEISENLQGKKPTVDDQTKLPYLDAVLKETLRLRPPAPLSLPHRADEDCTIAGYHVEKGTLVMQNIYGIGNLEKYFENPSVFDPDRWLRDPNLVSNLLAFGYGPTICLGMPLAKQEFFLAAASILQRYKFKIGPSTPSPDFTGEFKLAFNPKQWKTVITLR